MTNFVNGYTINWKKIIFAQGCDRLLKEERFKKLLKLLEEREFCTVEYLSEVLNVSMPTIRRDLSELVNRGLIIRSHGGAMHMPLEEIPYPVNFRKSTHYREKASLAREAVKLITSNAVVFIDSSTSAGAIAEHLKGRQDLMIITNSLLTAAYLKNLGIRTYCLGGEVIGGSSAVGGSLALEAASNFNIDIMFFSSYGINDQGMIVDTSEEETALRAALLKNAGTTIFLCDSSKFGQSAMFNLAPLSAVSYLVTDAPVPSQYPSPKTGTILVE